MMWKRFLAVILSLCVLFCAVPGVSEEGTEGAEAAVIPAAETAAAAGAGEPGSPSEPIPTETDVNITDCRNMKIPKVNTPNF